MPRATAACRAGTSASRRSPCERIRAGAGVSRPKLLTVVQRYGDGIAGGAEAHARELVKRLRPHMDIEVLTTAASDYRTWENTFTAGIDWVDDVPVRRFPVLKPRAFDF